MKVSHILCLSLFTAGLPIEASAGWIYVFRSAPSLQESCSFQKASFDTAECANTDTNKVAGGFMTFMLSTAMAKGCNEIAKEQGYTLCMAGKDYQGPNHLSIFEMATSRGGDSDPISTNIIFTLSKSDCEAAAGSVYHRAKGELFAAMGAITKLKKSGFFTNDSHNGYQELQSACGGQRSQTESSPPGGGTARGSCAANCRAMGAAGSFKKGESVNDCITFTCN